MMQKKDTYSLVTGHNNAEEYLIDLLLIFHSH